MIRKTRKPTVHIPSQPYDEWARKREEAKRYRDQAIASGILPVVPNSNNPHVISAEQYEMIAAGDWVGEAEFTEIALTPEHIQALLEGRGLIALVGVDSEYGYAYVAGIYATQEEGHDL